MSKLYNVTLEDNVNKVASMTSGLCWPPASAASIYLVAEKNDNKCQAIIVILKLHLKMIREAKFELNA